MAANKNITIREVRKQLKLAHGDIALAAEELEVTPHALHYHINNSDLWGEVLDARESVGKYHINRALANYDHEDDAERYFARNKVHDYVINSERNATRLKIAELQEKAVNSEGFDYSDKPVIDMEKSQDGRTDAS